MLSQQVKEDWEEELNLLYVALTRAKQYLFVSGAQTKRNNENSWYSIIEQAVVDIPQDPSTGDRVFKHGNPPHIEAESFNKIPGNINDAFDLSKPFTQEYNTNTARPSEIHEKLTNYGILVHKLLELTDLDKIKDLNRLHTKIELALAREISPEEFSTAIQEVKKCLDAPELKKIFANSPDIKILNEVPICFIENGEVLYRIIDRLIVADKSAWIIDYKTSAHEGGATQEFLDSEVERYGSQLERYALAMSQMEKRAIRLGLYFPLLQAFKDWEPLKTGADQPVPS